MPSCVLPAQWRLKKAHLFFKSVHVFFILFHTGDDALLYIAFTTPFPFLRVCSPDCRPALHTGGPTSTVCGLVVCGLWFVVFRVWVMLVDSYVELRL